MIMKKTNKIMRKFRMWLIKKLGGITPDACRKNGDNAFDLGTYITLDCLIDFADRELYGLSGDEWSARMYRHICDGRRQMQERVSKNGRS